MTPEAQRIALAEWEGIKRVPTPDAAYSDGLTNPGPNEYWFEDGWDKPVGIPDYLNDLNAVHRLEKRLKGYQIYIEFLRRVIQEQEHPFFSKMEDCIFATAAQRCEALLKTLGLWKE